MNFLRRFFFLLNFFSVGILSLNEHFFESNKIVLSPLDSRVTVTNGQKARLTCRFDSIDQNFGSTPFYQFIWTRQSSRSDEFDILIAHNRDLLISDPRLFAEQTDIDYSLIINDVTIDDEGIYFCEINSQPSQRAFIQLYVQEAPTIIDSSISSAVIKIDEHENVTLNCPARGKPTPSISWFRCFNQTDQDSILLANDTTDQFHFININRSQSGFYECRVSNGVNGHVASKRFEIRILFFPTIRPLKNVVYGTVGKTTQLQCSSEMPFDGKFSWFRLDNQPMSNQTKRLRQSIDGLYKIQTILQISEVTRNDFGLYKCRISSSSGQTEATVELKESRRTTSIITQQLSTTTRIQILKRNQIADQTSKLTITNQTTRNSMSFICFSLIFIHVVLIKIM